MKFCFYFNKRRKKKAIGIAEAFCLFFVLLCKRKAGFNSQIYSEIRAGGGTTEGGSEEVLFLNSFAPSAFFAHAAVFAAHVSPRRLRRRRGGLLLERRSPLDDAFDIGLHLLDGVGREHPDDLLPVFYFLFLSLILVASFFFPLAF